MLCSFTDVQVVALAHQLVRVRNLKVTVMATAKKQNTEIKRKIQKTR